MSLLLSGMEREKLSAKISVLGSNRIVHRHKNIDFDSSFRPLSLQRQEPAGAFFGAGM